MSSNGNLIALPFIILIVALAIFVYIIPIIVAHKRQHPSRMAITVLNIFLGWSFIGWIIALVWSCTTPPNMQR